MLTRREDRESCLPRVGLRPPRYDMPMRLWLKDAERLPDPAPVQTDDRKAMLVGMGLWVLAVAVLVGLYTTLAADVHSRWLWTCAVGLALGVIGLLYTHARRT
jgi:Protein of unknown function (DUF2530)